MIDDDVNILLFTHLLTTDEHFSLDYRTTRSRETNCSSRAGGVGGREWIRLLLASLNIWALIVFLPYIRGKPAHLQASLFRRPCQSSIC